MSNSLRAALELASKGIAVFPCNADKTPATSKGFHDAETDLVIIRQWFSNTDYLVGVPTGPENRLFVLDVDPQGKEWLEEHSENLVCERIHQTNRGQHFVYSWPEHLRDKSTTAGSIAKGIDTRGKGGYIIWWPAHEKGFIGDMGSLTPPPSWLIDQLASSRPKTAISSSAQDPAILCMGERNSGLASLAGSLRRRGLNDQQLFDQLYTFNERSCDPPLPKTEIQNIANSIGRYVPKDRITAEPVKASSSLDWIKDFEMTKEEIDAISDPSWVIPNFIPEGHIAAIAAPPGAGKTTILFHLCKSLTDTHEVVYVHADTNPSDAKEYYLQAENAGVTYLTPDMKVGLSMSDVVKNLEQLAASDADLTGHFWVFDTLKKMVDVIQKQNLKKLLQTMRKLSSRGMTIVLLSHTNKHKDNEGKVIFEGTADLKSDVDELIYLDPLKQPDGKLVVSTRPDKVRADITPLTFEIDAQRQVTQRDEFIDVPSLVADEFKREKDDQIIKAITEALNQSKHKQVEIIAHCNEISGIGQHRVRAVLKRYSANGPDQQWNAEKQTQNNTWRYTLLNSSKLF